MKKKMFKISKESEHNSFVTDDLSGLHFALDNLQELETGEKFIIEVVEMTEEEINNLGEFEGF